jgi:hypothetical protein
LIVVRAVSCALAVALLGSPAVAGPPQAEPKPGKKLCAIADRRLAEISGIVATEEGYLAVPDGTSGGQALEVFELSRRCRVVQRHSFAQDPFDPEDMAISKDGTLWIADTGDNGLERDTVALWEIAADRGKATLHRLKYPDGKRDAEALLVPPDGKPVIITKDLDGGGVAQVYQVTGPLQAKQTAPLKKVAELAYTFTGTGGGPVGALGQRLVTGAALSADGSRAVVRTYTDAYEYQVSDGDVVSAFAKAKPVRTPLPGEPQGEAITYSTDGESFITASEASRVGDPPRLYRYVPAKVSPTKDSGGLRGGQADWLDDLRLQDLKMIIAGVGVLGLLLLVVGVVAIRRARRGALDDDLDDNDGPDDWFRGPGPHPDDPRRWREPGPEERHDPYRGRTYGGGRRQPSGPESAGWDSGPPAGRAAVSDPLPSGRAAPRTGVNPVPRQAPASPAPYQSGGYPQRSQGGNYDDAYSHQPPAGDYWSR